MEKMSNLLFITQKIDENDDDLAFVPQWVDEFIKNNFSVSVICLEKGTFNNRFPVHSLGKELGRGKFARLVTFFELIFSLKYDKVFVHMNPEYFTFGGWWWFVTRKSTYLWYTHYTTHIHLRFAALFCRRMFAATPQSLPQYEGNLKKVVTGHGIDVNYWFSPNTSSEPKKMIMVHRISRSKRLEIGIEALTYLPVAYTLDIYGRPIDLKYYEELQALVRERNLHERVIFRGPLPMRELRTVYPKFKIMINMASKTIDKTMLEAMCNGVFPVTTPSNSNAIGLPSCPKGEAPSMVADFILNMTPSNFDQQTLLGIVSERHGLSELIGKISNFIKKGI